MKKIIFRLLMLLFLINCNELLAQDSLYLSNIQNTVVRVGISDNSFSKYLFDKISITSADDFIATDNNLEEVHFIKGAIADAKFNNGFFEIYNKNKLVLKTPYKPIFSANNGGSLEVVGLKRKSKPALYKGSIELVKSKTKPNLFAVVNVLPIQTYLKGVVPNEMPISFGLEALKAQAILARNYVLKPREKYYKEFDICDSTACQVYFGANTQESLSDKAVDETNNIVVLYDNDLILAVYSSTAGGYTESYKNVFMQNMNGRIMSTNVPYLEAVPDIGSMKGIKLDTEEKIKAFYSSRPDSFDESSPYFRWAYEWKKDELEKIIAKTLLTVKNSGFVKTKYETDYTKPDYFGKIKSIYINKRGNSGKIIALTIITDKNEFTIYKELIIRKVFLYNNKILPSANAYFEFKVNDSGQQIIKVIGGGLGHGVGMSQWGAGSMAKKGYKYSDIIYHYYNDTVLATIPVILEDSGCINQSFYINDLKHFSEIILKVDNSVHISDFNIIINNKSLEPELTKQIVHDKKIEISKYIKQGENHIIYDLRFNKSQSKTKMSGKFWIEFKHVRLKN